MGNQESKDEVLQAISDALENLCSTGRIKKMDELITDDPVLKNIIKYINKLFGDIKEAHEFIYALAEGRLDVDPPGRKNICASPPKQLQSQLSSLNWSLEQLLKGHIVSKIETDGVLYQNFNKLVDRVANASTGSTGNGNYALHDIDEQKINSWRYHQIMMAVNMLDIKVIETDHEGKVVYSNAPGTKLLNGLKTLTPETMHKNAVENQLLLHIANTIMHTEDFPITKEIKDSDNIIWYRVTSDDFQLPTGQQFYLHVIDDITGWKKNERKLKRTANTDQMTGTLSRIAGMTLLKALNNEQNGSVHCITFIDIDQLKSVNDKYGHNEGDDYIRIVSKILLTSTRSSEAVVRYGGDEFLVIFKDCTAELANNVIQRMTDNLEKLNASGVKKYNMSFSYGVQQFGPYGKLEIEDILEQADKKMYDQKKAKQLEN